jgi:hypothetical protein
MNPHFYNEEKILAPYLPEDNAMKKRLKEEHDHIRELVLGLDDETGSDKQHLIILGDLVSRHIRFEERGCLKSRVSLFFIRVPDGESFRLYDS